MDATAHPESAASAIRFVAIRENRDLPNKLSQDGTHSLAKKKAGAKER